MSNNNELVFKGFRHLLKAFAPYICALLKIEYGADWWRVAVMGKLWNEQKRDLPEDGPEQMLVSSLDIQRCLILFDLHWSEVFRKRLSIDHRTWAKELVGVRNKLAHIGAQDFNDSDTWRALDTMSRLCEQIAPEHTEEIRSLLRESRYGSSAGSTTVTVQTVQAAPSPVKNKGMLTASPSGLPCWRDVIEPHPDVAQGRYRNAEFAADLAQVSRGEGSFEYRDPVEFFARTYVTEGMSGLLVQALKRVSGKDGEPVIQLKTAFGGGKTHSMLALYHLLRGMVSLDKIPTVRPVLEQAGLASLPKVHAAVLVGTALDPSRSKRPQNLPGVTINTLWGEMAAQLALSTGDPKLYDYVKEADKKGISPGSESLKNLFDACGPCLILMDELVAYAKRIHGVTSLPAGSFDNFITFIQEITEAARASRNSLVVASIPESDIEVGGEAGKTGSLWPPTKALRSCAAVSSSTARTSLPRNWSAPSSAKCTAKAPRISLWKPRKSSTRSVCSRAIPSIPKCSTACTKTGPHWNVSSARAAFCALWRRSSTSCGWAVTRACLSCPVRSRWTYPTCATS